MIICNRGGEWYPENSGLGNFCSNLEILLGGVLNESRNLVFLCFFVSQILKFLGHKVSNFCFVVNGFDQTTIELFI